MSFNKGWLFQFPAWHINICYIADSILANFRVTNTGPYREIPTFPVWQEQSDNSIASRPKQTPINNEIPHPITHLQSGIIRIFNSKIKNQISNGNLRMLAIDTVKFRNGPLSLTSSDPTLLISDIGPPVLRRHLQY